MSNIGETFSGKKLMEKVRRMLKQSLSIIEILKTHVKRSVSEVILHLNIVQWTI